MDEILSRCGYRCDLCLAFRPNVDRDPANSKILSDGWFTYFGFRLLPESVVCDGCRSTGGKLIDQACPVRPCVISRGLVSCADCDDYVCERLRERLVDFDDLARGRSLPIPAEDRERFIAPYENRPRLETARSRRGSGEDSLGSAGRIDP